MGNHARKKKRIYNIHNLNSRKRNLSQEHLEVNSHQSGQVSQTSHSDDSFQDNIHENNQISARPTRAAKVRCSHNLTNIRQVERSYDIDVSRERAVQRAAKENAEQREQRLRAARQRAAQRVANENPEQRERRLRDARQRAAQYIANENAEQRERRLRDARQRAARRIANENYERRERRLHNARQRYAQHETTVREYRLQNQLTRDKVVPDTNTYSWMKQEPSGLNREDLLSEAHDGFQCNNCHCDVIGYRYTCVQCGDVELCARCEASGSHHQHYMLRVPRPRPRSEVQSVLATIRELLLKDGDSTAELAAQDCDRICIKSEVKCEIEFEEEYIEDIPSSAGLQSEGLQESTSVHSLCNYARENCPTLKINTQKKIIDRKIVN